MVFKKDKKSKGVLTDALRKALQKACDNPNICKPGQNPAISNPGEIFVGFYERNFCILNTNTKTVLVVPTKTDEFDSPVSINLKEAHVVSLPKDAQLSSLDDGDITFRRDYGPGDTHFCEYKFTKMIYLGDFLLAFAKMSKSKRIDLNQIFKS